MPASAAVELYWIPVGAGTSRLQQASLRLWEAFEAARARRPQATLFHSALKLRIGGMTQTLELMPAFARVPAQPLLTGPVGASIAGRSRLFRYQLVCLEVDALPDEQWAVNSPQVLARDGATAHRILALARAVPAHIWGRRVPGTSEMWTSDSAISWLLVRAGVEMSAARIPAGGRAPGWKAGIEAASQVRPAGRVAPP
jgi:hypothetical protein